jgi:uncharacterized protein (TIGR00251 family)
MAFKQPSRTSAKTSAKAAPLATATAAPRNRTGDSFFGWDGDTLVVNILGKPSASKDAIGKPKGTQLKVSVTAAPRDGKATDHMVRFLAPLFGVAVADIAVVFGQENVNKQLRIHAPKKLPAVFDETAGSGD